jgi:hypothetical protein
MKFNIYIIFIFFMLTTGLGNGYTTVYGDALI